MVGLDVAPDMIRVAKKKAEASDVRNAFFEVASMGDDNGTIRNTFLISFNFLEYLRPSFCLNADIIDRIAFALLTDMKQLLERFGRFHCVTSVFSFFFGEPEMNIRHCWDAVDAGGSLVLVSWSKNFLSPVREVFEKSICTRYGEVPDLVAPPWSDFQTSEQLQEIVQKVLGDDAREEVRSVLSLIFSCNLLLNLDLFLFHSCTRIFLISGMQAQKIF